MRARGMAVTAVVVAVPLAGRVIVPRVVVHGWGLRREGLDLGRGARRDRHAEVRQRAAQVGLARRLAVELDADRAGRIRLGLDHAGQPPEVLSNGPRAALAVEPVGGPDDVAVALGEPGARPLGRAPEAGDGDGPGVIVKAELGGMAVARRDDVGALDAVDRRQLVREASGAGVAVGGVGEEDVEVEAEGVRHQRRGWRGVYGRGPPRRARRRGRARGAPGRARHPRGAGRAGG